MADQGFELAQLVAGFFKDRVVGFSQVVPNPELMALPLARELDDDSSRYTNALAITQEGMEGHITARLLVAAIRKVGANVTAEKVAAAISSDEQWNFGEFRVTFSQSREGGSDWVEIGLRGRSGFLVR